MRQPNSNVATPRAVAVVFWQAVNIAILGSTALVAMATCILTAG